jgi:hypothetical protein
MDIAKIIQKADSGESLTVEEVEVYEREVKPVKHTYGKYGNLAKQYLENYQLAKYWCLLGDGVLPEYLHNIDKQADELYMVMYEKLSNSERFKRTGDFMTDLKRQTEMQHLIEEEILNELVYVDEADV